MLFENSNLSSSYKKAINQSKNSQNTTSSNKDLENHLNNHKNSNSGTWKSPKIKIEDKLIQNGLNYKAKKEQDRNVQEIERNLKNRYSPKINSTSKALAESSFVARNQYFNNARRSPRICCNEDGYLGSISNLLENESLRNSMSSLYRSAKTN